mmetsp:Transcript_340/g.783  ORF Transcript_340/g.783 Transcript_340/m.783 type:complete len:225 (-) Transcript_340:19-693(-)
MHYTKALAHTPEDHVLLSNRSASLCATGLWPAAVRDAEHAIALTDGKWAKAHARRADALSCMKKYGEALASITTALDIDKDNANYKSKRSQIAQKRAKRRKERGGSAKREVGRAPVATVSPRVSHARGVVYNDMGIRREVKDRADGGASRACNHPYCSLAPDAAVLLCTKCGLFFCSRHAFAEGHGSGRMFCLSCCSDAGLRDRLRGRPELAEGQELLQLTLDD